MIAAPLELGFNLTRLPKRTRSIQKNSEIIQHKGMIVTLITLQRLQAQISRLSLLREAKNDDFLLTNTSIWKEKKKSWKSSSVHVQRLKILVWKPRLGSASNSYNTGNFPHTPLPRSVHSRHSVSLAQCFSLSNFFQYLYLPYPPPNSKSISPGL